jgi:hypothetical protein
VRITAGGLLGIALVLVLGGACDQESLPPRPDPVLLQRCTGQFSMGNSTCPDGYSCVGPALALGGPGACRQFCQIDQPGSCASLDTCRPLEPRCTGEGCPGVCAPRACGEVTGQTCSDGYACIDDASDGCTPGHGPPCVGICALLEPRD